ncbi:MAG TPA: SGNH/GDSL hydrolase family protein [Anaerolineaceae bacterium]|nr:SGNH/GDSL hydrolase family protein [Anaerolineaceae bacterium]
MKCRKLPLHCCLSLLGILAGLSSCASPQPAITPSVPPSQPPQVTLSPVAITALDSPLIPTPAPTEAVRPPSLAAPSPLPAAAPGPTLAPNEWKTLPVIPTLSPRAWAILADGLAKGNHPRAFSKVGDCESRTTWFLNDFDAGPKQYSLGPYTGLQSVVDYYAGSFSRLSLAAKPGFNTASLLTPFWADPKVCQAGENSLACEYRLNRPAVVFVMLGTNDVAHVDTFEKNLRQILDYTIAQGVLPVLATKADNLEGDHRINAAIARLAVEYNLPLWNYWAAVQDLPGQGLQEDKAHLTYMPPFFDDPEAMKRAWPIRNLNALQILHEVMGATP